MHLPGLRSRSNRRKRALLFISEGVEMSSSKLVKVRTTSKSHASLLIGGGTPYPSIYLSIVSAGFDMIVHGKRLFNEIKR
jgi:hypothetical protein